MTDPPDNKLDEILDAYFSYKAGEHEPTSRHTPQGLKTALTQLLLEARLDELKNLPDNPDHIIMYVIARLQELNNG